MTEPDPSTPLAATSDDAMSPTAAKALVFFASGAVLVLEILANRLMAPYVGVSLETFTGIIGTMLAGIAAGAAIGGRMADATSPRKLLGPTLVLGGALAWLSLPILSLVGPGMGTDPASIVVLTSLAFLAPATVLSAASPMVTKLQLGSLDQTGSVVGSLSAAGTVGAIFATFLTGFVLAAWFPTRPTVLGLGLLIVLVGLGLWVKLGGTRPQVAAVAILLGTFGLGASSPAPCDHETKYVCASVVVDEDRPSGRSLVLDDLRHSYVDLEDPTFLDFRYFRIFADVVDPMANGGPNGELDVLSIGGAGMAFPGYVAATRPGSTNLVLEIDGELIEIAENELGFEPSDDFQVIVGDARLSLFDLEPNSYDLVIGDAFGGRAVPWHLTTTEVFEHVATLMRPDGVYLMNIIDGNERNYARAQLATLQEHFEHVALISPPASVPRFAAANQVLVASNAPLPSISVDPADGVLEDSDVTLDFIGDAAVLRDDFAPVDQLAKNS